MVVAVINIDITAGHARIRDKLLTYRPPVFTVDFQLGILFCRFLHFRRFPHFFGGKKRGASNVNNKLGSSHIICFP